MEKEKIIIQRIEEGILTAEEDEVAAEYLAEIPLRDGRNLQIACTPAYVEEMILGRRFLLRDLTAEEQEEYRKRKENAGEMHRKTGADTPAGQCLAKRELKQVELSEIFRIAEETFECPGTLFYDTGCAHCCALVQEGHVVCCIEDIGRHNALDKAVGYALKHGISMEQSYLLTSGRISGDYLQKVIAAGFPMVVSRAAVTSAAASLAREKNITMLGFVRKRSGNVYHMGRIEVK